MIDARSIKRTLNLRYNNISFGGKSRGTDCKTGVKPSGEKRALTTSGCATWNKGAPLNENENGKGTVTVSANGNALCWNENAGYAPAILIPIEIMVITAITITAMGATAIALRRRKDTVMV
ncbi:MAG: hypothetical protein J2P21_03580 [Chloracidobacterium sp.]|nr:hypothetical protein [Chloracidobacterium sp.]